MSNGTLLRVRVGLKTSASSETARVAGQRASCSRFFAIPIFSDTITDQFSNLRPLKPSISIPLTFIM